VFVAGWSYGGFAVLSCLTRQPADWAGGSAGAAIADWRMQYEDARGPLRGWTLSLFGGPPAEKESLYRDRSPIERAGQIRAPLLLFQGRNDRRTSARQIEAFVTRLEEGHKPYEIHWYDAGHTSLDSGEQALHVRKTIEFFRKIISSVPVR
jgi:dipeptidyl aminopeptidase/acylaminoacyl peptidase